MLFLGELTTRTRMKGRTKEARVFNNYLDAIKIIANDLYNELLATNAEVTSQVLKDAILGTNEARPRTIIPIWEDHVERLRSLIGKETTYTNMQKFRRAPAADMEINQVAIDECFYMSNMSPQTPSFNTGIWKRLESQTPTWAANETIQVITGGILEPGLHKIGPNKVACQKRFYKIIYNPTKAL